MPSRTRESGIGLVDKASLDAPRAPKPPGNESNISHENRKRPWLNGVRAGDKKNIQFYLKSAILRDATAGFHLLLSASLLINGD